MNLLKCAMHYFLFIILHAFYLLNPLLVYAVNDAITTTLDLPNSAFEEPLDDIQSARKFFVLSEDICFDLLPEDRSFQSCSISGDKVHIKELDAEREYLYFSNPNLSNQGKNFKTLLDFLSHDSVSLPDVMSYEAAPLSLKANPSDRKRVGNAASLVERQWERNIPENTNNDYFLSLRQWIKKYESPPLEPIAWKRLVLFRNQWRVYALDRISGNVMWNFAIEQTNTQEYHQSFSHPHVNDYRLGLTVDERAGQLFSELGGHLVALKFTENDRELLWKYPLGEYSICVAPIVCEQNIICGFVNSRGEFWMLGFDRSDGSIIWKTYIGLASFLNPGSTLSYKQNTSVIIGTHMGILFKIDFTNGKVLWAKKYLPKTYDLFDYWNDKFYEDILKTTGSVMYDTEFLMSNNKTIYFKSRESSTFEVRDKNTGNLYESFFMPINKYLLLSVNDSVAIIAIKNENGDVSEVCTVNLSTYEIQESFTIKKNGPIRGVYHVGESLYFKVGSEIYVHNSASGSLSYIGNARESLWLTGVYQDETIILNDEEKMVCLMPETISSPEPTLRALIKEDFEAIFSSSQSEMPNETIERLYANLKTTSIPVSFFANLAERYELLSPLPIAVQKIFDYLACTHKNEYVNFDGFRVNFALYLASKKLITQETLSQCIRDDNVFKSEHLNEPKEYSAQGEKIRVLPIESIGNPQKKDFYLILNWDQLLCVHETGYVLWAQKIFYLPQMGVKSIPYYNRQKNDLYNDVVKAYLLDGTLIVNDSVSLLSLDVTTGKLLWSTTTTGKAFQQEKLKSFINPSEKYQKYGISPSFYSNVCLTSFFIGDTLHIVRNGILSKVDWKTGSVVKQVNLGCRSIIDHQVVDEKVYFFTLDKTIVSWDCRQWQSGETIQLNIDDESGHFSIAVVNHQYVLMTSSRLYLFDKYGVLIDKKRLRSAEFRQLIPYKNSVTTLVPFGDVQVFTVTDRLKQYCNVPSWYVFSKQYVYYPKEYTMTDNYYVQDMNKLIFFQKRYSGIYCFLLDLETGIVTWKNKIPQVEGLFFSLSNAIVEDNIFHVLMTMVIDDPRIKVPNVSSPVNLHAKDTTRYCVLWRLSYDLKTGESLVVEEGKKKYGFRRGADKSYIDMTKNCYIETTYGNFLEVKVKTDA